MSTTETESDRQTQGSPASAMPELIAISGQTGCGKTETIRRLVAALAANGHGDYATLDCGSLPRQWAAESSQTIDQYIATMGPGLDPKIDDRTLSFFREEPLGVVTGRLACHMARDLPKSVFRVWLYCPAGVRASRRSVHVSEITGRDEKDSARYLEGYRLVYPPAEIGKAAAGSISHEEAEMAPFDLLVSTEKFGPDEIVERILACGRCWQSGYSYVKIQL